MGKHLSPPGRRSLQNSRKDQRPGFQNGLVSVPAKKQEIQIHLKARKKQQRRQKKKKIMKRRKKRRRRRRKKRNKFIFQSMPRLKSNPNNFIHSMIESLLLYQSLVCFTQRVNFPCFVPK